MNFSKKAIVIAAILLAAGFSGYYFLKHRVPFAEKKPAVQDTAPEIFLADLSGKMIKLSDLRGKVVLVNFWASWCPPCKAELTEFQKVYEKYESSGFEVVAIAINDITPSSVMEMRLTFPVAMINDRVSRDYGDVSHVPASYLVDKEGRIVRKLNEVYATDALIRDVEQLLKQSAQGK